MQRSNRRSKLVWSIGSILAKPIHLLNPHQLRMSGRKNNISKQGQPLEDLLSCDSNSTHASRNAQIDEIDFLSLDTCLERKSDLLRSQFLHQNVNLVLLLLHRRAHPQQLLIQRNSRSSWAICVGLRCNLQRNASSYPVPKSKPLQRLQQIRTCR